MEGKGTKGRIRGGHYLSLKNSKKNLADLGAIGLLPCLSQELEEDNVFSGGSSVRRMWGTQYGAPVP